LKIGYWDKGERGTCAPQDRDPHLFVSIVENFLDAAHDANCADEAQNRDIGSIGGEFELEADASVSTSGEWWSG